MDTNVLTPMNVFHLPGYFVVPLFQRPYVWTEDEQWLPLWHDVRRMAEIRLNDPATAARHFLGAIVLQAQDAAVGHLATRNVIDGQQRLTTLQLLMDAAAAVLEEQGQDMLVGRLDAFTHNPEHFVSQGWSPLKLRHTNRDQAAFDEVMEADPPVVHDTLGHAGSLLVRAHKFFAGAVDKWLAEAEPAELGARAEALTDVLSNGLQLVVIDLQPTENSQEIFETLNARGTPLTAADLIKNYVFQRLDGEGVDTRKAYAEDWPFESKFWESEVSVGRFTMTRGSLFLNQWLISRVGEEVGPRTTFSRFKSYVEHDSGRKMSELLPIIKHQAAKYEGWTLAAGDPDRSLDPVEMAVYRMQAAGVELLKPILLWLHEPEAPIPPNIVAAVVGALESWVVRRQLLRLTSGDQGRVIADIIRLNRHAPAAELPDRVRDQLSALNAASTYWPGDAEIRESLSAEAAYRRYPRGRLRMLLEAVENKYRATSNQPQVPRRGFPIEHVLPQKWESAWAVAGLEAQQDRANHVHRFGNLTLLTTALNSSVSNGPWAGPNGKRAKLHQHDTFLMNRVFREPESEIWDEARIDARTASMIDGFLEVWPVPAGHIGEVVDRTAKEVAWIDFRDVVASGLVEVGTSLVPREGKWSSREARVRDDGLIEIDDRVFDTPSGAARYVKGSASNGWYFWRIKDGPRLADIRTKYRADKSRDDKDLPFDWSRLHAILERVPEGSWTSYFELADAIGTAPQAIGNHLAKCSQCTNAHRVLTVEGGVSPGFRWIAPDDKRDPAEMLALEGVSFTNGLADAHRMLTSDDLAAMSDV